MDWFFDSIFGFILTLILGVLLFFGGVVAILYPLSSTSCTKTAEVMGLEHQFGFWTDCLVKDSDGHWIPLDKYRAVENVKR